MRLDFHDWFSSASHLGGALWAAFAAAFLLRQARGTRLRFRLTLWAYAASVVGLYTASGLFHGLAHETPRAKQLWMDLDRTAIYAMIVSSGLPIMEVALRGAWRTRFQLAVTTAGLAGVAAMWLLPKPDHRITVAIYAAIGFFACASVPLSLRTLGRGGVRQLLLFAGFYVAGAACEMAQWPTLLPGQVGPHELFHVLNLLGTMVHYGLLVRVIVPAAQRQRRAAARGEAASPAGHPADAERPSKTLEASRER